MTRKVIKSFRDLQDGGKMYAPNSRRFNTYTGDREEELFKLGYLGEVVGDEISEIDDSLDIEESALIYPDAVDGVISNGDIEIKLEDMKNKDLEDYLNERHVEYPKGATKKELIAIING